MYADDDRDRNRDPQSKSATRQQRRAERDQSGFDSKNDSEQYADALSLGRCDWIVDDGNFP